MKNLSILIFAVVLKVQRGETESRWNLSRRQRKGGVYFIAAIILGLLSYSSYSNGNTQLAGGLVLLALLALIMGFSD